MNIKEQSLKDALNEIKLDELPKQFKESSGDFWLKAVVLVKKQDTTLSYALAERNSEGLISYKKDFGTMSPIAGLISVHPYVVLDKERFIDSTLTPEGKKDKLVEALGKDMEDIINTMTEAEVDEALEELAAERQIQLEAQTNEVSSSVSEAVEELKQAPKREGKPTKGELAVNNILKGIQNERGKRKKD